MRILPKVYSILVSIVTKVFLLLEFFLFLRLFLEFIGANPKALIVSLIYKYSHVFVSPFDFIFNNLYWRGHLIEIATLSAMLGYAILVSIILRIIHFFPDEIEKT